MTQEKQQSKDAAKDTFSLEDLDQILEAEDPGFTESLNAIKKEGVQDSSSIEAFSVDSKEEESGLDTEEENAKAPVGWREKLRKKILVPVRWVKEFSSARKLALRNRIVLVKTQTAQYVRHGLPDHIKYARSQGKIIFSLIASAFKKQWSRPRGEKFAFLGISVCVLALVFILIRTFTSTLLPDVKDDLLRSFATQGEVLGTFSKSSDYMPLFEAFPEIEFQVRLEKVTVNLRPDEKSGRLPMGLFEFYLGVDSRDTAVELRDREKEMLDLLQRTIEGFTYTEVMSRTGKARLKSRIRDNFNATLNQGRVMNVYLNRIVTTH